LGSSILLVYKSISVDEQKIIYYEEKGNLDYRVYLKPNEFYETPYLTGGMTFIARLINNIEVDVNYNFNIDENVNIDYNYDIIGRLTINNSDNQKLFEKEYTLLSNKALKVENSNQININEKLNIDYDYYNDLANNFKSTYAVETINNLDIYVRVNKKVINGTSIDLNETSEMNLNIPLTERTINIRINNTGINNKNSIIEKSNMALKNMTFVILAIILFIGAIAAILKSLGLLSLMFNKSTKYDRFIKKVLKEYDRLIVETETEPNLKELNIIKIRKFQELLDVRDNLKKPIMYYIVNKHQKSYFYIQNDNNCYLLTVKAVDLESSKWY